MGPPVCTLALEPAEHPMGFTESGGLVVTTKPSLNGRRRFGIWDAVTGGKRHDLVGPLARANDAVSLPQGVIVGLVPAEDEDATSIEVLDLASGQRRTLECNCKRVLTIHDDRPWVALSESGPLSAPTTVKVFDFRTGELVLECIAKPGARRLFHCQFTEGDELLLISGDPENDPTADVSMEIARYSTTRGELERRNVVQRRSIGPPVRGGRAVGSRVTGRLGQVEVAEIMTGRILFRSADLSQRITEDWSLPVFLSATGRRLLNTSGSLWSVDDGRAVWRESLIDGYIDQEPTTRAFLVLEHWHPVLEWLYLSEEPSSRAVRDMENGAVRRRYQGTSEYWQGMLRTASADGRRFVDSEGNVYQPSLANWPLLVCCQTILALPLILLWAALRWRCHRRLRLATPAP